MRVAQPIVVNDQTRRKLVSSCEFMVTERLFAQLKICIELRPNS
jgi:hypothetical protein